MTLPEPRAGDTPEPDLSAHQPRTSREPASPRASMGAVAVLLVAVSAAAIFFAGLVLGGQSGGRDAAERAALGAFLETYRRISTDFVGEAEPSELVEGAIRGMFETLDDPYSAYMDPDEYEATFAGISGEFEGVGARMGTEDAAGVSCEPIGDDCLLIVTEVLPDTPALAAGLMNGDVVTAVDARELNNQTIDGAVLLIRGPRGSEVVLTVDRDGVRQDVTITRDVIVSQDVRSAVLADGRIGYLRVDGFSSSAAEDFANQLGAHLDAGIKRLVIDVRDDPGGFVDAAVEISSQFLADGPVFWEEGADGAARSIDVEPGGLAIDPDIEVIVLIDDGSASASEIVAGALRDAGRARLVGETSFGKGTVQEWTRLSGENGGFRLSVAKWLTRDREWIHGSGLKPDVEVPSGVGRFHLGTGADAADDAQLSTAISLLLGGPAPDGAPGATPGPGVSGAPDPSPEPARLPN